MHRKGHSGMAMIAYAPIILILLLIDENLIFVAGYGWALAMSVSMLPDIDIKISSIKHRGPTHTVWFALGMGILTSLFLTVIAIGINQIGSIEQVTELGVELTFGMAAFLILFGGFSVTWGIISHFFGDIITPMGLRPFKPVKNDKYTFDLVKAANETANSLLNKVGYSLTLFVILIGSETTRTTLIQMVLQYL